ncbi:MAG: substrate binding domain-containing protein, partial [Pseudomonadota bacterium]
LFFRSTRSMSLTPEGRKMIDAARRMVGARNEALDALAEDGDEPVGKLKVTMPAFGDAGGLHGRVWRFLKAHPKVGITLHLSDAQVDLVKEGFDVAFRLGQLRDSALRSRRIGRFDRTLVAAPAYLAERAPIRQPEDLLACEFVAFSMLPNQITLERGGTSTVIKPVYSRVSLNAVLAVKAAVQAGMGIQRLPTSEVSADIAAGRLVEVLPDWSLPTQGIYAVWPDTGTRKRLTRRFIEAIAATD